MANPHLDELRAKAAKLPLCPGVYLMKNEAGTVIYVGKSRKLKNRVSSYFIQTRHNAKTEKMVSHVADFDYILCDGEMEALTLENTLIKKYTPHYNIRLKDAKSYPYLKVTQGAYPRVIVTRKRESDGGKYYGPYSSSAAAHEVCDTVNLVFSLPSCHRVFPRDIGKGRPCLYAQMGRCIAPCTGTVTPEAYHALIRAAEGVLSGNIRATERDLTDAMTRAAESEQYELAARYRDSVAALRRLSDKQKVVSDPDRDRDVLALYTDDLCTVLAVLNIQGGMLQNKSEFLFTSAPDADPEDRASLVTAYYREACRIPPEVLLSFDLDAESYAPLSACLGELAGHRVTVRTPERGDARKLADMARANAADRASRYRTECERSDNTLITLSRLLALEVVPDRIEAYDISEIGSEQITGAMIVTDGARLLRSDYRTFRIRSLSAPDDYAAMRETLSRRLAHIGDGTPSLGQRPDLILLDGGVGQVHAVQGVLREMELDIPVFGMVKDDFHKTRALTDGERELSIAGESAVYVFLYKLQEEVHRVAVRATMGAKGRSLRRSTLEDIPGIGPAKAKKLLRALPIATLKTASVAELTAAGISPSDAERVRHYYHPEEPES